MSNEVLRNNFWKRVDQNAIGVNSVCWTWLGSVTKYGYGSVYHEGKSRRAHRVSLQVHGIDIPKGMCVDHICRNRLCVNPSHLRVVDLATNTLENSLSTAAFNKAKTHCPRGHEYFGENKMIRKSHNRKTRICRICYNEYARKWTQKNMQDPEKRKKKREASNRYKRKLKMRRLEERAKEGK